MRKLFCLNDLDHNRFVVESDGAYHKILVFNSGKDKVFFKDVKETEIGAADFYCDVCGGEAVDFDDAEGLDKRLSRVVKRFAEGRIQSSPAGREALAESLSAAGKRVKESRAKQVFDALEFARSKG